MVEEKREATYEEYLSATRFARFKYKYGLIVLIACWICLALMAFLVWHYADQLTLHPAIYMMKSLDVDNCVCYGDGTLYNINRTTIILAQDMDYLKDRG